MSSSSKRWLTHLEKNLHVKGQLFLIRLGHYEGEFAVGLGRRTFGESAEQAAAKVFEIEWFERKGKKRTQWGQRPAFKLTVASSIAKHKIQERKNTHLLRIHQTPSCAPRLLARLNLQRGGTAYTRTMYRYYMYMIDCVQLHVPW